MFFFYVIPNKAPKNNEREYTYLYLGVKSTLYWYRHLDKYLDNLK